MTDEDIVRALRSTVDEPLPMARRSEREAAANEIERLNKECFSLAANQCHHGYGDDYGNHRCKYQDEIERLKTHAKRLSNALLKVRPLGGSEMFVRVGDDYYADPDYCGELIDRLRSDLHEARCSAILAARAAALLADEIERLRIENERLRELLQDVIDADAVTEGDPMSALAGSGWSEQVSFYLNLPGS